jgi:hypothetical protein
LQIFKKKVPKYLNVTMNMLITFYLISLIYFIFYGKIYQIAPCFCSLIITILIKLLSKKFINTISPVLIFSIVIFTFAASYLGSSLDFYGIINHYDDIMHFLSGILVTLFGFDLFIILNVNPLNDSFNRKLVIAFSFSFSLAIAGLWEISEFLIDYFFLANMQAGGLNDTMLDMINALLASIPTILAYEVVYKKIKIK